MSPKNAEGNEKEMILKARHLLFELMHMNKGIKGDIWCAAINSVVAEIHMKSGCSFEKYKESIDSVSEFYKEMFPS